jgi:hypothetical protein
MNEEKKTPKKAMVREHCRRHRYACARIADYCFLHTVGSDKLFHLLQFFQGLQMQYLLRLA